MSINNSMLEKAAAFDKDGQVKREVAKAIVQLKEFRAKFRFAENLGEIERLNPDSLFEEKPEGEGEFFIVMEGYLKTLGYSTPASVDVCRNVRQQISDFKNLLRATVDGRKSLAQKVDAPWERIGEFDQEKQLALEIIFTFNCQRGTILPIFSIDHLRHFASCIADVSVVQTKYPSLGQEYEHHTMELIKIKNSQSITRSWDVIYFTRFLYITYPPPDLEPPEKAPKEETKVENATTHEKPDLQGFMKLLGELQKQHKITGEQFRENRELWLRQQPNDREVLVWQLKRLLNTTAKTNPDTPRSQPFQKPRKL